MLTVPQESWEWHCLKQSPGILEISGIACIFIFFKIKSIQQYAWIWNGLHASLHIFNLLFLIKSINQNAWTLQLIYKMELSNPKLLNEFIQCNLWPKNCSLPTDIAATLQSSSVDSTYTHQNQSDILSYFKFNHFPMFLQRLKQNAFISTFCIKLDCFLLRSVSNSSRVHAILACKDEAYSIA